MEEPWRSGRRRQMQRRARANGGRQIRAGEARDAAATVDPRTSAAEGGDGPGSEGGSNQHQRWRRRRLLASARVTTANNENGELRILATDSSLAAAAPEHGVEISRDKPRN
ncbi:unnamed protein product [Lampetra planeri]